MSYRRLRERNNLERTIPLDADPYTQDATGTPGTLLGDWNRFERDVAGLSCWCPRGNCVCGHGSASHSLALIDGGPAMRYTYCLKPECTCRSWDAQPPHRDETICPANDYAANVARRAGVNTDHVRAVVRALMETQ